MQQERCWWIKSLVPIQWAVSSVNHPAFFLWQGTASGLFPSVPGKLKQRSFIYLYPGLMSLFLVKYFKPRMDFNIS